MISGRLLNADGEVVIAQAYRADKFFERLRGLLGRSPLDNGQALVIDPCNSIHTIAMKFPIDVMFLDSTGSVVKIVGSLRPYRYAHCLSAKTTVEMRAGAALNLKLEPGAILQWAAGE